MPKTPKKPIASKAKARGQLRIGDHWNAITILALSQSNPLKAIAEFVENSIDAGATTVHLFRGKKKGHSYLRIVDNGRGIPRTEGGEPDFKYVATHIGDSIKRYLKAQGAQGIQGEFGIGLLSFWTVGEQLTMRSSAADGHVYQMVLTKGRQGYEISRTRALFAESGTELVIQPLLPGLRQLSGEKLQWYLGSELRNRLLERGVRIFIHDLISRNEYEVQPQRFTGRKLVLGAVAALGAEIYLNSLDPAHRVALYRQGTRVLEDVTECGEIDAAIWRSGYLSGFLDWPELQLTPGTRQGIVRDERFERMLAAIRTMEPALRQELELLRQSEQEHATRATQATIQRAFKDALGALPPEEYDWFDFGDARGVSSKRSSPKKTDGQAGATQEGPPGDLQSESLDTSLDGLSPEEDETKPGKKAPAQSSFFEFPGPIHSLRIMPASCIMGVGKERALRAVARDRKGTPVSEGLGFAWRVVEGSGELLDPTRQEALFRAADEPGVTRLELKVSQGEIHVEAKATITVTASLIESRGGGGENGARRGLPDFTYERVPGELWRSRYDSTRNLVVINSGHSDFLFASSKSALKLKYLVRLFSKELVLVNFPGAQAPELLDRLIEVSLRAEESLR